MPRPKGFDYQRYLASREWALIKEQVRERCEGWCEHCYAAPYQDTHHLTYERIGRERVEDLMGVCRPCHAWLSGKAERNPLNDAYSISEVLTSASGIVLHMLWQSLDQEAYEPWRRFGDRVYYQRCGPDYSPLRKCIWCEARTLEITTFYTGISMEMMERENR